jgi:hypothetical protein
MTSLIAKQVLTEIIHQPSHCGECGKPPERVYVTEDPYGEEFWVTAVCSHGHGGPYGRNARLSVNTVRLSDMEDPKAWDWKPLLRFFRRNWAEYHRPTIRELLEKRNR